MKNQCNCWVSREPAEIQFGTRFGAHNPMCAVFAPSMDPVKAIEDADQRYRAEIGKEGLSAHMTHIHLTKLVEDNNVDIASYFSDVVPRVGELIEVMHSHLEGRLSGQGWRVDDVMHVVDFTHAGPNGDVTQDHAYIKVSDADDDEDTEPNPSEETRQHREA